MFIITTTPVIATTSITQQMSTDIIPTSTVSQLQQPTSTVSQSQQPTSTVSQLLQLTSTVQLILM